ncbi:MAG: flagellar basal body P-ring formation protein FlgA [Halioglobus sp.]|nr:flagellar basal body P-ring formation protein FlgA [Halioglobus sp.]
MASRHWKFVGLLTPASRVRRITDVVLCAVYLLLLGMRAAMATVVAGDAIQPLAEIEHAAETYLAARATSGTASATALDPRLRLARCDETLRPFLRDGARIRQRTIVGVRCTGSQPWKVYVPVNLAVTENVLVLASNLPRGHALTEDDLHSERRDVSRLPGGYLSSVKDVLGQRLKQSLRAGSILSPAALQAELLIRRGQTVTLSAATDAISIRMSGKALMDGTLNQRIRVENGSSGRVVEGMVRSAERVEVLVQ